MQKLYKRINKTSKNLEGYEEMPENVNPFENPCLLCLSAQSGYMKSVYGTAKVGAALAGVRVKDRYGFGYDIDTMPVSFLASTITDGKNEISLFVDKYFVPLVSSNGNKIAVNEAAKALRNINILTYCDGTYKAKYMEEALNNCLNKLGYTDEEMAFLLKQIVVIPIATTVVDGTEKTNLVSFKDVNDDEVRTMDEEVFLGSTQNIQMTMLSPNVHKLLYKGDGDHDLKKYAYDDKQAAYISYMLAYALSNSVQNSKSDQFIQIDLTSRFIHLSEFIKQGLTSEQILNILSQEIDYPGAVKLTKREALLSDKYDYMCIESRKQKHRIEAFISSSASQNERKQALVDKIREYCSDTTALRILLEAKEWQVNKEELAEIMATPTDKEIVEQLRREGKHL